MPKRTGQVTDLEKYFWKAENIQKLLGTDYVKNLLKEAGYKGKIAVGSKEFVRVAREFGHLECYYQKQGENADVQESCSGKSADRRPTYLFAKCLACRIITQLDSETKMNLANNFDRTELGRMVLSKKELQSGILDMVTDTDLIELLQTQCYFQADRAVDSGNELADSEKKDFAEDDSQDSNICWMYGTDKCSPQILIDLCAVFKQGRGKGIIAFTYTDLNYMCQCFYNLYPAALREDDYVDLVMKQKNPFGSVQNGRKRKEPSVFSSDYILRNSIKGKDIGSEKVLMEALLEHFKRYFARQFENKDRAEKWFERLTQKYYQLRSTSNKSDNLLIQVQRWRALWEYVICRYMELRCEEKEQTKKEKLRSGNVDLNVLLEQIVWEYCHANVYKGVVEETHEEGDIPENEWETKKNMRKKCCNEINFIIDQYLSAHEKMREISPENEMIRLIGKAFYDLEKMVMYMTRGWQTDRLRKKFTKYIVEGMLGSRRIWLGTEDEG